MKLESVGEIIATRTLSMRDGTAVVISIGKPTLFPEGTSHYCPYQIIGGGMDRIFYAGGVDSVQALELALKMIGTHLYTSDAAKAGDLRWEASDKENYFGFPVPDAIKDLLP